VGTVRNDGSSNFVNFYQTGRRTFSALTNIFTAKAAAGANTYALLAGGDLTNFQSTVPPIATTASITLGSSAGTNSLMAVASDANGVGAVHCIAQTPATTIDDFAGAASAEVGLKTSQNIYWKCGDTHPRNVLSVSGYSI